MSTLAAASARPSPVEAHRRRQDGTRSSDSWAQARGVLRSQGWSDSSTLADLIAVRRRKRPLISDEARLDMPRRWSHPEFSGEGCVGS